MLYISWMNSILSTNFEMVPQPICTLIWRGSVSPLSFSIPQGGDQNLRRTEGAVLRLSKQGIRHCTGLCSCIWKLPSVYHHANSHSMQANYTFYANFFLIDKHSHYFQPWDRRSLALTQLLSSPFPQLYTLSSPRVGWCYLPWKHPTQPG